jgi:tetratricopeptide (TPR) repeat protein
MESLQEAIRKVEQAIKAIPNGHPDLAKHLSYLASLLESRFEQTNSLVVLEEAICNAEHAVAVAEGHPDLAVYLSNLGSILQSKYDQTGKIEDLRRAISYAKRATEEVPETHSDRAAILSNLAPMLRTLFERTREKGDLDEAIDKTNNAIKITPEESPDLAAMLNNLANYLELRFELVPTAEDLEMAILKAEQAILAAEVDPNLPMYLSNLSSKLERRFEWSGRIEDLREAFHKANEAVEATPEAHPHLAKRLNNLGIILGRLFEHTGEMENLERAISFAEKAVELASGSDIDRASVLTNLSIMLWRRSQWTGRTEDLDEAVLYNKEALNLTLQDHLDTAGRLNNLGNMLESRFKRTGKIEDLQEAVQYAEQAVRQTPEGHSDRAGRLNNLANMLESRFQQTRRPEDLQSAVQKAAHAVQATHTGHSDLPLYMNCLSTMLESQFRLTRREEDLREAIETEEQAVKATPDGHPDLALYLKNLGIQFSLSSHPLHQSKALESFMKSWACTNGQPFHRLTSALNAIELLQRREDWNGASAIARAAIYLLPTISNRSLNRNDKQYAVSRFSGLAAVACSLSLQVDSDAAQALQLLERGRGTILGLLIDDRSDISKLRDSYPKLATEYDNLRMEINAPPHETIGSNMRQGLVARRVAALKEFEDCIQNIRQLSGFERFLLGPTLEEMKQSAKEGPIVFVNITRIRSDAIIVSRNEIRSITLQDSTEAEAKKWIQEDLTRYRREDFGRNNKRYREFLFWLWIACVKPVLHILEPSTRPPVRNLPRIWWIGVGIANSFPFHAAGDHSAGSIENTFSWTISSYTPSIKALAFARQRMPQPIIPTNSRPKLLIVEMCTTPGETPLEGVKTEASDIEKVIGHTFTIKHLVQPHAKQVLDDMKNYDFVHFACHGMTDATNPSESCLLLQKSQGTLGEPVQDPLSVRTISLINLTNVKVAYLSACSTAENKSEELADEVIHIASGFQVAGFPHVVACLWPSKDTVCVEVARRFYETLATFYSTMSDNRYAAAALHDSIGDIRSNLPRQPLAWAQYVHLGA